MSRFQHSQQRLHAPAVDKPLTASRFRPGRIQPSPSLQVTPLGSAWARENLRTGDRTRPPRTHHQMAYLVGIPVTGDDVLFPVPLWLHDKPIGFLRGYTLVQETNRGNLQQSGQGQNGAERHALVHRRCRSAHHEVPSLSLYVTYSSNRRRRMDRSPIAIP